MLFPHEMGVQVPSDREQLTFIHGFLFAIEAEQEIQRKQKERMEKQAQYAFGLIVVVLLVMYVWGSLEHGNWFLWVLQELFQD